MYLIHSVKNSVRYTPKSFKQELALFTLGSIDMWAFVYLTHQWGGRKFWKENSSA